VIRSGLVAAALSVALGALGAECGTELNAKQVFFAEGDGGSVAFAMRPTPAPVGKHFDIDFVVCSSPPLRRDATIGVDADMPAHRHGMNYRATVTVLSPGIYRASGLMFHMPGRWRVFFDLPLADRTLRLTDEFDVR
jgi:hypothetical protein